MENTFDEDQELRNRLPSTPQECFNYWVDRWAFVLQKPVSYILNLAIVKESEFTYTGEKK